jgi:hypothetical protein
MENIHSQSIPELELKQILDKLDEAYDMLRPYLHALSVEQRSTMLRMGDKSLALVEKTAEQAEINPQFAPQYFSLADLRVDLSEAVALRRAVTRLQQITREVEDTMMLAGHEAFAQALVYYNAVKHAAANNASGAKPVYDELRKRYPGGSRSRGRSKE